MDEQGVNEMDDANVDIGDLLDQVTTYFALLEDVPTLLKVAVDLGLDVPEPVRGSKRGIRKIVMAYLNGDAVEGADDILNILGGIVEELNDILYPAEEERELENPDERGAIVEGGNVQQNVEAPQVGVPPAVDPVLPNVLPNPAAPVNDGVQPPNLGPPAPRRQVNAGARLNAALNVAGGDFVAAARHANRPLNRVPVARAPARPAPPTTPTDVKPILTAGGAAVAASPGAGVVSTTYRGKFKFDGVIGEPPTEEELKNDKCKKLSYSNVAFQISNAQRDGFRDTEICSAVVKAVTVQNLRNYLEECAMEGDLTVETLLDRLQTHFKVKSATHYYNEMVGMTQGPEQTAMSFATGLLDLKKKVLRMSREGDGSFSEELVQEQFQTSLLSGLRHGSIREALRWLLKGKPTDDEIRREISDLMLTEAEHEGKVNKPATVSVSNVKTQQEEPRNNKKTPPEKNPLVAQVRQDLKKFGKKQDNLRKILLLLRQRSIN